MAKSNLQKLQHAYDKADWELRKEIDRLFPVGCKVYSELLGWEDEVISGSLYADQVRTKRIGHCSPNSLRRIDDAKA